ncbi:MAG: hypothetical protein K0R18_1037, partial [Bacillales bacterium]|nr:hypothetical protein [Bacillales bacterium]
SGMPGMMGGPTGMSGMPGMMGGPTGMSGMPGMMSGPTGMGSMPYGTQPHTMHPFAQPQAMPVMGKPDCGCGFGGHHHPMPVPYHGMPRFF